MSSLDRLAENLRERGGLLATLLSEETDRPTSSDRPAQIAACGPRTRERAKEYELLIEAIYEGYLLHYGDPRVLCTPEADLRLLAGDHLYALGLSELVALGDIQAVSELADVITLSALAQEAGDLELADAVWAAGAHAVGWGSAENHARAKELAFAGEPGALEVMCASRAS